MRRFILIAALLGLFAVPTFGQFQQGDSSFTLSGSGASDKNLDDTIAAASFELGHFLSRELSIGVRQNLGYADGFSGSTAGFADFNFGGLDRFVPFVGVSAGTTYGESSNWFVGPSAGVSVFVNDTTFIRLEANYLFDAQEGFSSGGLTYGIGIGVRF